MGRCVVGAAPRLGGSPLRYRHVPRGFSWRALARRGGRSWLEERRSRTRASSPPRRDREPPLCLHHGWPFRLRFANTCVARTITFGACDALSVRAHSTSFESTTLKSTNATRATAFGLIPASFEESSGPKTSKRFAPKPALTKRTIKSAPVAHAAAAPANSFQSPAWTPTSTSIRALFAAANGWTAANFQSCATRAFRERSRRFFEKYWKCKGKQFGTTRIQ